MQGLYIILHIHLNQYNSFHNRNIHLFLSYYAYSHVWPAVDLSIYVLLWSAEVNQDYL